MAQDKYIEGYHKTRCLECNKPLTEIAVLCNECLKKEFDKMDHGEVSGYLWAVVKYNRLSRNRIMNKYKKALLFEILVLGCYVLEKGIPNTINNVGSATFEEYKKVLILFQQRKNKKDKKTIAKRLKEYYFL